MEGDSVVGPVIEEGLGNMRLTTFETLQIIGHIAFLQDFPDLLTIFPSLTILRFLFTRLTTHVQRKKRTLSPEKLDAEDENVRMNTGVSPNKRAAAFPGYVRVPNHIHISVLPQGEKTSNKVPTPKNHHLFNLLRSFPPARV